MCWLALFLFLSVSTRDKRDEINIFVAGDPCRKEHPMLKVFATQVVVSRGYDGAAAIKFSEKGDAVRFRIGKKVYDPTTIINARQTSSLETRHAQKRASAPMTLIKSC